MRQIVVSLLLAAAASVVSGARQEQAPPAFRAAADLLTLEAAVIDGEGRPVRDLKPADFAVTIDGKPRKVLFARFSRDEASMASPPGGAAVDLAPGTAAVDLASGQPAENRATGAPGRIILFVVDRDSIKPGNERPLFETASTILDTLGPSDAVGLLGLPVGGVDVTREHERVRQALSLLTGTRPKQMLYGDRYISWEEALGYERNDPRVLGEVTARECQDITPSEMGPPSKCPDELRNQAREMLQTGRAQLQTSLSVMGNLFARLAALSGPKHVIFISGGMPYGPDLLPAFETFAKQAAEAQVVLYAVHLDQHASDTSDRRVVASGFGGREMTEGLTTMTGLTGGAFFNGIGRAAGVFDRIKLEMANFYELGLETTPEDANGRPHSVDVKVPRTGLSVRSRRHLAMTPASVRQARANDPLLALLQQPINVTDLPLSIVASTTRGDEDKTLRVVIGGEMGTGASRGPGQWGFVVLNEGNVVASGRQKLDATAPWAASASARLAPGHYRLRVAAADAGGAGGVLDVPLTVGLRAAAPLQMSDVVLGVVEGGRLLPKVHIPRGTTLAALIEVLSDDPAKLEKARATIEIIPVGTAQPVQKFMMAARSGSSATVLLNEAQVATAALTPGRYTASIVALLDDQPVGRVTRVFEIVGP